jgi:CRISPR system Cascade subunit CasB
MHTPGPSLGRAVAQLSRRLGGSDQIQPSLLRRFHSVATATNQEQRLHHLRSLITLLRANEVPLDYARLSIDLYRLSTGGADRVLLSWGRDLYRRPTEQAGDDEDTVPSEPAIPPTDN